MVTLRDLWDLWGDLWGIDSLERPPCLVCPVGWPHIYHAQALQPTAFTLPFRPGPDSPEAVRKGSEVKALPALPDNVAGCCVVGVKG